MTLLRIAIEVHRLDLAAYALLHSAAVVLSAQSAVKGAPAAMQDDGGVCSPGGPRK